MMRYQNLTRKPELFRAPWARAPLGPGPGTMYPLNPPLAGPADECATTGNCKISRLLFADDLVLLSSTESGLQRVLNIFADACNTVGIKAGTVKTEVLHLSRNPDQCVLQVNGATLKQVEKFKYLGVAFTSDRKQDEELDTRIGKARAVVRALHYSVVTKRELSKTGKLSVFKTFFAPILTCGHESWVMTEGVRSQVQASEMRFLRRIEGVTLFIGFIFHASFNKMRSSDIGKSLNMDPLLLRIERSQMIWPCKQNASGKAAQTSFTCQSKWETTSWSI